MYFHLRRCEYFTWQERRLPSTPAHHQLSPARGHRCLHCATSGSWWFNWSPIQLVLPSPPARHQLSPTSGSWGLRLSIVYLRICVCIIVYLRICIRPHRLIVISAYTVQPVQWFLVVQLVQNSTGTNFASSDCCLRGKGGSIPESKF